MYVTSSEHVNVLFVDVRTMATSLWTTTHHVNETYNVSCFDNDTLIPINQSCLETVKNQIREDWLAKIFKILVKLIIFSSSVILLQ
jgi:hypothetical protein